MPLFKVDKLLVVADDPLSDPALAQAVRNAYEYKGQPGAQDDPALGGVRLLPIDLDGLRIQFDKHVAVEKTIRTKEGETFKRIISHPFNAKTHRKDRTAKVSSISSHKSYRHGCEKCAALSQHL